MVHVGVHAAIDVPFYCGYLGIEPFDNFLVARPAKLSLDLFKLLVNSISELRFILCYDFSSYCLLLEGCYCEVTGRSVTLFQHFLVTL